MSSRCGDSAGSYSFPQMATWAQALRMESLFSVCGKTEFSSARLRSRRVDSFNRDAFTYRLAAQSRREPPSLTPMTRQLAFRSTLQTPMEKTSGQERSQFLLTD